MTARPRSASAAAIACLALALGGGVLAGCGDSGELALPVEVTPPTTSWVTGQSPLFAIPAYMALEQRAVPLGQARYSAYQSELRAIAAAKIRAKKKAKADALRKYLEAKRRAERLYKLALKRAAEMRRKQAERLRRARLERARKLRELMRKLRIKPGQECSLPEVQAQFHCLPGRYPLKLPSKH
jgi:hypothetical protein